MPAVEPSLRIVHCVRSAVGGTFRHIADLARMQAGMGHAVGLAVDSRFGGAFERQAIEQLAPVLALGVTDIPVGYGAGPGDILSAARTFAALRRLAPDVIHGHGAKGGLNARLAAAALRLTGRTVACLYTPHGGSLHHDPEALAGRLYFAVERVLERACDGIIHVSGFEQRVYRLKVGVPRCEARVIVNGLREEEFELVEPAADAADVGVMGMFRDLKGQDVLLRALASIRERTGRAPSAVLVGEGPAEASLRRLASELGLADRVSFRPLMPTRAGFASCRVLVVPSRAESMPYIVLEAVAAGLPLVASAVGGIPEIIGDDATVLVPPGEPSALATTLQNALTDLDQARSGALARREVLRSRFTVGTMASEIEAFYQQALASRMAHRDPAAVRAAVPAE